MHFTKLNKHASVSFPACYFLRFLTSCNSLINQWFDYLWFEKSTAGCDSLFTQHRLPLYLCPVLMIPLYPSFFFPLFFFYTPQDHTHTHQQTDGQSSGWLQLTLHLEMRTKVCNEAPKINRMWLIAATVTLGAQTARTRAGEEMRGALSEESQSHLLWKSCATEIGKGFSDQPCNDSDFENNLYPRWGREKYV